MRPDEQILRAAEAIAAADALLITAGAGMGVDSGLPDFRGTEGFWRAYPPYKALGLRFEELANPGWFHRDPELAWGFYGHRLNLYRSTEPHDGFRILLSWVVSKPHDAFVFTSNVDGQFQKAGFEEARIAECHGSIHHMQCLGECGAALRPADEFEIEVDAKTMHARPPLPACGHCGAMLRPNVLMFGDWAWDGTRTDAQYGRLTNWLRGLGSDLSRLAIVECGAGTAIPTVRHTGESLVHDYGATLVRINVREPHVPPGQIGIAAGAETALKQVAAHIGAGR